MSLGPIFKRPVDYHLIENYLYEESLRIFCHIVWKNTNKIKQDMQHPGHGLANAALQRNI